MTTTLTGMGCFPEDHELSLGMLGMHGTQYANYAMQQRRPDHRGRRALRRPGDRQAGGLRARGDRSSTWTSTRRRSRKNVAVDVPIVGDAKRVLASSLAELKKLELSPERHLSLDGAGRGLEDEIIRLSSAWTRTARSCPSTSCSKIWEATRGEAIVCTEVGQHQMWAAQFYLCHGIRASSSAPAAWAPWASASRRPSARRWPARTSW